MPYLIAVAYILLFAYLDKYPYDQGSLNDQGLFQRVAMNVIDSGKFSGSTNATKVFCPTRPPLYPLIMAFTWKITNSRSLVYIRSIQAICYLLSIFFIFRISTILADGDTQYGILASLFASLIPHTAAVTHVILAESLGIFLLILAVWIMVRQKDEFRPFLLMLLGLILGLLTLQRPNFLYIPFFFAGYLICSLKYKTLKNIFACCVLIALPFTMVLLPWGLYKQAEKTYSYSPAYGIGFDLMAGILEASPSQYNAFFPVPEEKNASVDSKPLYGEMEEVFHSQHELLSPSTGYFTPRMEKLVAFSLRSYCGAWSLDPVPPETVIRTDRFLTKTVLTWIRAHPVKFLAVILNNAKNLIFGDYHPLIYQPFSGTLSQLVSISRLLLYLSFAAGILFALRSRRVRLAFVPLLIVLYLIALHSLMHADPRYFVYSYMLMAVAIPSVIRRAPEGKRKEEAAL